MLYFPVLKTPRPPYDIQWDDNVIRSKTESGHVISRKKYTKNRTVYKFKWEYFTTDEYLLLEEFYNNTTASGSLEFTFLFVIQNQIQRNLIVMFIGPPKCTYVGMGLWEIECNFREV